MRIKNAVRKKMKINNIFNKVRIKNKDPPILKVILLRKKKLIYLFRKHQ